MTALLLEDTLLEKRRTFVRQIVGILGKTPVAGYLPWQTDSTTSIDPWSGKVWTADAIMSAQIVRKGKGFARVFNGTSNYLSTPDAASLSFVEPVPVSFLAVCNVTDTAANRYLLSKGTTVATDLEYIFVVNGTDLLLTQTNDNSAAVQTTLTSDGAITQGVWGTLAFSYSGAGGASAGNGMVHYQNGTAFASTPTNNAGYVAMEDQGAVAMVGARNSAVPTGFFAGSIACVIAVASNLSAAQQSAFHKAARAYFEF